jgi:hypothetical protein
MQLGKELKEITVEPLEIPEPLRKEQEIPNVTEQPVQPIPARTSGTI